METSPVPSPAAATELGAWHLSPAVRPGACWGQEEGLSPHCYCVPSACHSRVPGPGGSRSPAGAHGARAKQRQAGTARAGCLPPAGEEPGMVSGALAVRAHSQRRSVCLSVCQRAWSGALTGCQAVPLPAPRGLLVLEGKVWPFPPVSETRPASPRNKLLPKALASEEPGSARLSAECWGDPVPLQLGSQRTVT